MGGVTEEIQRRRGIYSRVEGLLEKETRGLGQLLLIQVYLANDYQILKARLAY